MWDTVPSGIPCRVGYRAVWDVLQLYKAELRQEAKEELERLRMVIPYPGNSRSVYAIVALYGWCPMVL